MQMKSTNLDYTELINGHSVLVKDSSQLVHFVVKNGRV